MSIMCCVYVPEGIVLAADSRLTRTKQIKSPVEIPQQGTYPKTVIIPETTYTLSDNTQKVLLIKKADVGVSFCGNAIINGMTVADFIRRFEIECVTEGDTTEKVALKLAKYYGGMETHFFVIGYDNDAPFVFDIEGTKVVRKNIKQCTTGVSNSKDAADDGTETLLDVGIPENVKAKNDNVENLVQPTVIFSALWAGQKTAITKIVNNPPILNADWGTMPLKDAIDFAEFLVDTTIKYERFCDDIQTCGGDIDILVVTKDEAFWKQHKIFNPKR